MRSTVRAGRGTTGRWADASAEASGRRGVAIGLRVAAISVLANVLLSVSNVLLGLRAGSTSVVAAGFEFAGDVLAASLVYLGFSIASRPADHNHPYGHGRAEVLSGLVVGVLLFFAGATIAVQSLRGFDVRHPAPDVSGIWPLLAAIVVKSALMSFKFGLGRRVGSSSLVADGWNDAVDILAGFAALTALGLTLSNPEHFLAADHFGGFAVGLIVISIGLRVVRETSLELMDTMPSRTLMERIRAAACQIDGARAVEKCWARKTGLRYHVDLHLEVDPTMTVADSHGVAERVRHRVRDEVPEVEDVLVHVEPFPGPAGESPAEPGRKRRESTDRPAVGA